VTIYAKGEKTRSLSGFGVFKNAFVQYGKFWYRKFVKLFVFPYIALFGKIWYHKNTEKNNGVWRKNGTKHKNLNS
jgi:hypothetical protein